MCDIRSWNKDFLADFIAIYEKNPCLWKIKSKDYSNKHLKSSAYEMLAKKLKEIDENATKDEVIKKINSIRGSYRKERNKVKQSSKSGAGSDQIHKPTLWYYHLLSFLGDQESPKPSFSNIEDNSSFQEDYIEEDVK